MSLERFRKIYSLLPEKEKELAIVVIDDVAYTWNEAFIEIKKGTELGEKIQKKLEELEII